MEVNRGASEEWVNGVNPQVRSMWPEEVFKIEGGLEVNRRVIDELTPKILAAFAHWYELFLINWLAAGKRHPSWTTRDWAFRLRRTLNRHVAIKCQRAGISGPTVEVYFQPIFNSMLDTMLGLLGGRKADLDFLVQGMPQFQREKGLRLGNLNLVDLRALVKTRMLGSAAEPTDHIFALASERLVAVTRIGLSKGPDNSIHDPEREQANLKRVREVLQGEEWLVTTEFVERFYVRCYQAWMNAATDRQFYLRKDPEAFQEALVEVLG